ncbi:MAG: zinc-binding dehydrogenase [Planctomycetota bacterium]|nr:zinc-binding dehydrogenase [Planctomycetota bacterium]MDA1137381.1 zinc-binding dehydrogenase [Planctomycetota bacterium]
MDKYQNFYNVDENYEVPATMQALVMSGTDWNSLAVKEVPVPRPNQNQLLARVDAAGVCSSLLKILVQGSEHKHFNGWDPEMYPVILGDEGALTVVEVGKNVQDQFSIGNRCSLQPAVHRGPINHLERYNHNAKGMEFTAVGYTLGGCLAQYILIQEEVLEGRSLVRLPDDNIPYFAASLAEPVSCVVCGHERHFHIHQDSPDSPRQPVLGIKPGGVCVIIGAGPMGRIHAELVLRYKPAHVIVNDLVDARLKWMLDVIKPRANARGIKFHVAAGDKIQETLMGVSNGRGADDVIVAVGVRPVQQAAIELAAPDGVVNLFGGLKRGDHIIYLDTLKVHYDQVKVVGSSGGLPSDITTSLELMAAEEIIPGNHVGLVGSLHNAVEALQLIEAVETEGKTILYPHVRHTGLFESDGWTNEKEIGFLNETLNDS